MKPVFFGPTVVLLLVLVIFHLQLSAGTYCNNNTYLKVASRGVVSCDFGVYDTVGWLNPTKDLERTRPFIYREGSETHGPEPMSGEYSMFPNGSLIIENVTLDHEKNYIVRVYKNGEVSHHEVPVSVYALPVPEYPVVNGRTDTERVVVPTANGKASFNCTMDHVRPAVSLELVFVSPISNGISMTTIPSTLYSSDGTYNVSLEIRLTDVNLPSGTYFLECRVAESFAHLFTSVSTIDLSVCDGRNNFPSVNGLDSQQHVVLDVNREGKLNCSIDRFVANAILEWNYINHDSSSEILLGRQSHFSVDNGDGSYNITSITSYRTIGESVQSVTLKCVISGKAAQLYTLFTTVELHFPPADRHDNFPLVNGLESQQHVYLDVNRTGTLNCSMNRVLPSVNLEWDFTNRHSVPEMTLGKRSHSSLDNGDGTYNITLISIYNATDESVQYVTLKCMVSGKAADLYPLFTTVELHFPAPDAHSSSNLTAGNVLFFCCGIICIIFLFLMMATTMGRRLQLKRMKKTSKCTKEPGTTECMLGSLQNGTGHESTRRSVEKSEPNSITDNNG